MCRAWAQSGGRSNRRCKGKGVRSTSYTSERLAKSAGVSEDELLTFPEAYKAEKESLKPVTVNEDGTEHEPTAAELAAIERSKTPVDPQDFDNFHRVVSKMINKSDMSEHDKRIARKQWNATKKDVEEKHVTYAKLAAWQKVLAGTALAIAAKIPDEHSSGRINWRQMGTVLQDTRPVENIEYDSVHEAPAGYATREEFEKDFPAVEDDTAPTKKAETATAPVVETAPAVEKKSPRVSSQAYLPEEEDDEWVGSSRDDEYDTGNSGYSDDDEDDFDLDRELAANDELFQDELVGDDD